MADTTCHVLYVEDTPEDARLLAEAIQAAGVPVQLRTAVRGEQAIRIAASEDPVDVVLLDWNLPGHTGPELLEDIRRHRPTVPIFVLTGLPVSVATAEVGEKIETVIAKPFTMDAWEDLARLVASFCDDISALEAPAASVSLTK